jgi:hypothetical protein
MMDGFRKQSRQETLYDYQMEYRGFSPLEAEYRSLAELYGEPWREWHEIFSILQIIPGCPVSSRPFYKTAQ